MQFYQTEIKSVIQTSLFLSHFCECVLSIQDNCFKNIFLTLIERRLLSLPDLLNTWIVVHVHNVKLSTRLNGKTVGKRYDFPSLIFFSFPLSSIMSPAPATEVHVVICYVIACPKLYDAGKDRWFTKNVWPWEFLK